DRTVADLLRRRTQRGRVTPSNDYAGPRQGEGFCRSEADAAVAADNDGNLPLEAMSQEFPLSRVRRDAHGHYEDAPTLVAEQGVLLALAVPVKSGVNEQHLTARPVVGLSQELPRAPQSGRRGTHPRP